MRNVILAAAVLALAGLAYADTGTDATDELGQDAELAADNPAGAEEPDADKSERISCIRETGSRLRARNGCLDVAGRTYTQEDIRSTGRWDAADALGILDPGIQIRR